MASNSRGQFVWYELMTTDLPAAEAFYQAVVGWQMADAGMPGMRYTLLSAGSHQVAGAMALTPEMATGGARPAWTGYISVPDVDAGVQQVQRLGGAVHLPGQDIPGVGRFAIVADPQGAVFCLFTDSGGSPPPPAPHGTPGEMGWHELYATDQASVWPFYAEMFGWAKGDAMDMGAMGTYQLFGNGGATSIGGMMSKPPQVPVACWQYYINVADVGVAAAAVKAHGGQVLMGPMQVPGGSWVLNGLDPQGAAFSLIGPKA